MNLIIFNCPRSPISMTINGRGENATQICLNGAVTIAVLDNRQGGEEKGMDDIPKSHSRGGGGMDR